MKLQKYEFTEEAQHLLPTPENKYGKFLEINGPDGYFKLKARLICDYHVDELLKRSDGAAEKYFKPKSQPGKSVEKSKKKLSDDSQQ